ncbi:MAG: HAMP domain-containing histidine kinase [Desertifilum sp.]|nr:HAMP domain-containing histidine kinase [Desertifilum sp.]
MHQQQLPFALDFPGEFQREYAAFVQQVRNVQVLITEVERFVLEHNKPELARFLQRYLPIPQLYLEQVQAQLGETDISALGGVERAAAQQALLALNSSTIVGELEQFSIDLRNWAEQAFEDEDVAHHHLDEAIQLRWQIIAHSIFYTIILGIIISLYTSRAIATPIQNLTHVARRVTQESNFELQAEVKTQDEVGILAVSLNQLIQRVNALLKEQKAEQATRLLENEKMSSLGQMLAGVAHEINNPVNFIYGNLIHADEYIRDLLEILELYQEKVLDPPSEIRDRAEELEVEFLIEDLPNLVNSMQVGADRVRQIVLSLKNFSRLDDTEPHPVNVQECIESTLLILNNRIKKGIQIACQYGNIPPIPGYTGLLYQVFMNIISNAIDALLELPESRDKQIKITTECQQPEWLVIRIADNGMGISPENQAKIYDAFFTTKPRGVGTGLGLAISYQIIVEKHNGKLTCDSQVDEGTEFTIFLPLHPTAENVSPATPANYSTC